MLACWDQKKRTERLLNEITEEAARSSAHLQLRRSRLFAPIGIDIGAETPEEIALSIVAEIKAFFRSKTTLSLRDKDGPIHEVFESQSGGVDIAPDLAVTADLVANEGTPSRQHSSAEHVNLQCQL